MSPRARSLVASLIAVVPLACCAGTGTKRGADPSGPRAAEAAPEPVPVKPGPAERSPSTAPPPPVAAEGAPLDEAALAALHAPCPEAGCPAGQQCVEWCGVAGCRPGLVQRTCEIRCRVDAQCPAGLACGTIADGPGRVCSERDR